MNKVTIYLLIIAGIGKWYIAASFTDNQFNAFNFNVEAVQDYLLNLYLEK